MRRSLSGHDLRKMLDLAGEAYLARDRRGLGELIAARIADLIGSDSASYNEFPRRGDPLVLRNRPLKLRDGAAIFARSYQEHPLVVHHRRVGDTLTYRFSDVVSRSALRRLAIYNEYYRAAGIEHQMAVYLTTSALPDVAIALNRARGSDFTDRERGILTAIGPLLSKAYDNVVLISRLREESDALERGLAAMRRGIIVLRQDGTISSVSSLAERWLSEYFDRRRPLPAQLAQWSRRQLRLECPAEVLRVPGDGKRLAIRLARDGARTILIFSESLDGVSPEALAPLRLSPRETEVLSWVAQGKTDHDISVILSISVRTVHHHVGRVLSKLRVETRSAAAAIAREATRADGA